jgi:hypothetical protein
MSLPVNRHDLVGKMSWVYRRDVKCCVQARQLSEHAGSARLALPVRARARQALHSRVTVNRALGFPLTVKKIPEMGNIHLFYV